MSGQEALQPLTPLDKELPAITTSARAWSKRTGLPQHKYTGTKEFGRKHGDMSKLDKYGRPTHTKEGDKFLRFR